MGSESVAFGPKLSASLWLWSGERARAGMTDPQLRQVERIGDAGAVERGLFSSQAGTKFPHIPLGTPLTASDWWLLGRGLDTRQSPALWHGVPHSGRTGKGPPRESSTAPHPAPSRVNLTGVLPNFVFPTSDFRASEDVVHKSAKGFASYESETATGRWTRCTLSIENRRCILVAYPLYPVHRCWFPHPSCVNPLHGANRRKDSPPTGE
jgi:hypothetical protein